MKMIQRLNVCALLCMVSLSFIKINTIIIKSFITYAARAVFASCPNSYNGCTELENISVTAGENVYFNASIIHIPGGNCGFKQMISSVVLKNCTNIDCMSLTGNTRVSSITSPERFFLLSNSTIHDSGVYQVIVTGINPQNGAQSTSMEKTYRVTVQGEH
jgi:hypothetical protein